MFRSSRSSRSLSFALSCLLASAFQVASVRPVAAIDSPGDSAATDGDSAAADATPQAESRLSFNPALVGLPGFPDPPQSAEDYQRAADLVEARLMTLQALLASDESPLESTTDDSAEPVDDPLADPLADPRVERLEALRAAVQQAATLGGRIAELEAAVEQERERADSLRSDGIGLEPPYSVTLFDQLLAERVLRATSEESAKRRLTMLQRRQQAAEQALTQAVRSRRQTRDELEAAVSRSLPAAEREPLERQLEVARLDELVALHQTDRAAAYVGLTAAEGRLAEAQQASLSVQIEQVRDRIVVGQEALDERLENLSEREQALRAEVTRLRRAADLAERRSFEISRELEQATDEAESTLLSERVATAEAEISAARTGAAYLAEAADQIAAMQDVWERRFQLAAGVDENFGSWLADTLAELAELRDEKEVVESELASLRSAQLALSRRLSEPAISDSLRAALLDRDEAFKAQEERARRLLEIQDEFFALLTRVREQLEPLASQRSFAVRWMQAREAIAYWWDFDLFESNDQSIRVGEVVLAFVVFLLVVVAVSLLKRFVRRMLARRIRRDPTSDDSNLKFILPAMSRHTSQLFVLIVAFYVAMSVTRLANVQLQNWLWNLLVIASYLQIGFWANAAAIDFLARKRSREESRDPSAVTGYGLLMVFVRTGIWIIVAISALVHFEYPIAGVIGAFGVGGIAIAFAVQNILGDIFSSMAIILDKPFRIGDFVTVDGTAGVIEHIGVKTTRIRSLSGEQIVMSNTGLLASRIHNFKHLRERRVVFKLSVAYETPADKLAEIPAMLRQIVQAQSRTRFDRAHFCEYGDFALIFEIVYYVIGPDYSLYMDIQQAINLEIHRRFEANGIVFAYPTQELILRRNPATQKPHPVADEGD